jgi:hypothetical protein
VGVVTWHIQFVLMLGFCKQCNEMGCGDVGTIMMAYFGVCYGLF